ncbi:hypothetical protein SAMN05421503_2270 [Terribacillus aidingensis]|uniref:Uncharacterized protein n=1 Tax=Terribacillus aidingensis TaxID=586416 RepID=A0A285P235_9BACI|nr:hypothetical protein SAMN05421503_2270 [Terribacillus aidingensis]
MLLLKILIGTILGLVGVAYEMLVSNPNHLMVFISSIIGAILIGWAIAEIILNNNTSSAKNNVKL